MLQFTEIISKQLLKNFEVMLGKLIHAAIAGTNLFTGNGKGIFTADEQKGQIIMPKIFVKAINGANIKQFMYLLMT